LSSRLTVEMSYVDEGSDWGNSTMADRWATS
jgi:hypothetical protein